MTNPFSIHVTADQWGTGNRNDCYWNIAKNQLGEGASAQEIAALTEELIALNNEKAGKAGERDTLVETGQQIFIPLEQSMDEIQASITNAQTELNTKQENVNTKLGALTEANGKVQTALGLLQSAKSAMDNADPEKSTYDSIQQQYQQALNDYNTAIQEQQNAQSELEQAEQELTEVKENILSFQEEYKEIMEDYEDEKEEYQTQIEQFDQAIGELEGQINETNDELEGAKQEAKDAAAADQQNAENMGLATDGNGNATVENEEVLGQVLSETPTETGTGTGTGNNTYAASQLTQEEIDKINSEGSLYKNGVTLTIDNATGDLISTASIITNSNDSVTKVVKREQQNGGYTEYQYDGNLTCTETVKDKEGNVLETIVKDADGNELSRATMLPEGGYKLTYDEIEENQLLSGTSSSMRTHYEETYDSQGTLTHSVAENYTTFGTLSGETYSGKTEYTRTNADNGEYTETTVTTNPQGETTKTEKITYNSAGEMVANPGLVEDYQSRYNNADDKTKQSIVTSILKDENLTNRDILNIATTIDLSEGTDGKNKNSGTNKDFVEAMQTRLNSFENPEEIKAFLETYGATVGKSYVNTIQTSQKDGTETSALKSYFHLLESKVANLETIKQTSVPANMTNQSFTKILDNFSGGNLSSEQAIALLYAQYPGGIDYMMNALHGGAFNLSDGDQEKYAALLEKVYTDSM